MKGLPILVVEDNPLSVEVLKKHLKGHKIDSVGDAESAKHKLDNTKYDLCFIDIELNDGGECSGLNLIELARLKGAYTVVMSGHRSEEIVERAYTLGCDDFYAKGNEEINVRRVLEKFHRLLESNQKNNKSLFTDLFITRDPDTRKDIEEVLKFASSTMPILILGPSGTGKTSLARVIHDHSRRRGEFVAINCSSYTEELLEAELFGYKKGAFTGALEKHKGRLVQAAGGTLFLDEIGSMSLKMQAKLLKAIEEKCFYPLGSDTPEKSDFRVISATLENLQAMIKSGQLRFDFFQRILGPTITLKPLSERPCDIFPLIELFTRGDRLLSFTREAKRAILVHSWYGNVRELKNFVDVLMTGGEGRVTEDAVKKLLPNSPDGGSLGSFVTDEQYRYALSHGMAGIFQRVFDSLVERNLAANGNTRTRVMEDLQIGTNALYASLRRIQPDKIRAVRHRMKRGINEEIPTIAA